MQNCLEQFETRNLAFQEAEKRKDVLLQLNAPPEIEETTALQVTVNALGESMQKLQKATVFRDAAARELDKVEAHFHELEQAGDRCSQCGSPLTYEHLTRKEHDSVSD